MLRGFVSFQWTKSRKFLSTHDNILNTGYYKYLIIEFILALLSPHIFLKSWRISSYVVELDTTIYYGANDLVLFFVWLKFYIVLRTKYYTSKFCAP